MPTQGTTRPLTAGDRELLRTATLANVNWTGEQRFTSRDVDERPDLRHYTVFRPGRGDLGFVSERHGLVVGVVWALLLGAEDPGYGFVADGVPELSLVGGEGDSDAAPVQRRGRGGGGRRSPAMPRHADSYVTGSGSTICWRAGSAGRRPRRPPCARSWSSPPPQAP